jgi:starch synthase
VKHINYCQFSEAKPRTHTMASMGSPPFTIETKSDSSMLLHSANSRRPRFLFFAYRPRKPLDSSGNTGLSFGYSKAAGENYASLSLSCDRLIGGCSRGQQRRITRPKATGGGFVEGEDGGDEVEDALEATIEKSKKVLAMQRDLLQQVFFVCVCVYTYIHMVIIYLA